MREQLNHEKNTLSRAAQIHIKPISMQRDIFCSSSQVNGMSIECEFIEPSLHTAKSVALFMKMNAVEAFFDFNSTAEMRSDGKPIFKDFTLLVNF